eukprot:2570351-Prymnesium_polylepis.1
MANATSAAGFELLSLETLGIFPVRRPQDAPTGRAPQDAPTGRAHRTRPQDAPTGRVHRTRP